MWERSTFLLTLPWPDYLPFAASLVATYLFVCEAILTKRRKKSTTSKSASPTSKGVAR